jgi:hypothetical protein
MRRPPLPESSIAGPALVNFNSILRMAWTQADGTLALASGMEFGEVDKVLIGTNGGPPESSIGRPALAVHDGRLFVAWTGTDGIGLINIASSVDGRTFTDKVTLGESSIAGPALISAEQLGPMRLTVAWTGTDSEHHLNLLSSGDGLTASSFTNKVVLPDTSVDGPSLSAGEFGLDPFLAWTAGFVNFWEIGSGRKHVYDDTPPPGDTRPVGSDTSYVAPTLATLSGAEINILAYTGGNQHLYSLTGGIPPDVRDKLADTSEFAPALAWANDGMLYWAWTGTDGARSLNFQADADMPRVYHDGIG